MKWNGNEQVINPKFIVAPFYLNTSGKCFEIKPNL